MRCNTRWERFLPIEFVNMSATHSVTELLVQVPRRRGGRVARPGLGDRDRCFVSSGRSTVCYSRARSVPEEVGTAG